MTRSAGRQAEREQRWKRAVADQFEAIIDRIEGGATLDQACRHLQHGQNLNSVRRWLRLNPAQVERIKAIRMRLYGSSRGNGRRIPAAHWEAGLRFVATTSEQNLTAVRRQGIPHIDEMRRRAARDPDFARRLDAAFAQRNARHDVAPARHSEASYAEAVAYLKANRGRRLVDLSIELRARKLPPLGTIYSNKYRWPWLAAAYSEITADRGVKRYDATAHAEAIGILQADPRRARHRLREAAGRLPSFNALRSRALTRDDAATAQAEYRASRLTRRIKRAAERRAPKRPYAVHVLRSGLLLDDLYGAVSAAIPRWIDPDQRDDMISEVVLAVLDGRMQREDIAAKAKSFGLAALSRDRWLDTLDRPISDAYGDVMVVDTLTTSEWSFEGAI